MHFNLILDRCRAVADVDTFAAEMAVAGDSVAPAALQLLAAWLTAAQTLENPGWRTLLQL